MKKVFIALLFLAASRCFAMQQTMVSRMTLAKPVAAQESSLMDTLLSTKVLIPAAAAALGYWYLSDRHRRDQTKTFMDHMQQLVQLLLTMQQLVLIMRQLLQEQPPSQVVLMQQLPLTMQQLMLIKQRLQDLVNKQRGWS